MDEKENLIHESESASDYDTVKDKTWVDNSISVKGQRQIFECKIKTLKEDNGIFEGYASTFGNVDKGNDIVVNGAFKKSLRRRPYNKVKLLYQKVDILRTRA